MKTMTVALAGLLVLGLVAAVPSASAASDTAADQQERCIGIYEEDSQGNKKCTGVWTSTLCYLLPKVECPVE